MENILKHVRNKKGDVISGLIVVVLICMLFALIPMFIMDDTNKITNRSLQQINDNVKYVDNTDTTKKPTTKDTNNIPDETKQKMKDEIRTELKQEMEKENKVTEEKHGIFYDINMQVIAEIIGTIITGVFLYILRKIFKKKNQIENN